MNEPESKLKVSWALKLMAQRNDVIQDTHGNVSQRDGGRFMWIKPSGVPYEKIGLEDICGIDFFGVGPTGWIKEVGKHKPSVDTPHHMQIYLNNPHVEAICHTHSPYVVAHAIRRKDIPCMCTEHADYFGGDIPCLPYKDLNSWGDIRLEKGQKAVLLGCHGGLTFASDAMEAVKLAIQLENVARKNHLAGCLDGCYHSPLRAKGEIEKWHERYNNVYGQK